MCGGQKVVSNASIAEVKILVSPLQQLAFEINQEAYSGESVQLSRKKAEISTNSRLNHTSNGFFAVIRNADPQGISALDNLPPFLSGFALGTSGRQAVR